VVITTKLGDSTSSRMFRIGGASCHCSAYSPVLANGVMLFLELFLPLFDILDLCF